MKNQSMITKFFFVIVALYIVIYSIFLFGNFFAVVSVSPLISGFYASIFITLIGSWSLWKRKRLFNKSFWKYFLIFQLVLSTTYFYLDHNMVRGLNPIFVEKLILFSPLTFIIYWYTFKCDDIWNNLQIYPNTKDNMLKNNILFLMALILITINYNPYSFEPQYTPEKYKSLGYEAGMRGDLVAEKRYNLKGIKKAKKLHEENTPVVAKIYHNLSIDANSRFNDRAAYIYSLKSIAIYEKLLKENKINKMGEEYSILEENYYSVGVNDSVKNDAKKLSYITKALEISVERKDTKHKVMCYQALGDFYNDTKDYKLSEQFYKKAIILAKQNNLEKDLAVGYKLYGDSMFYQKKYAKAEYLVKQSITILKKINDDYEMLGNSYNVLGKIYEEQGKCDEAYKNYVIGYPMMNKSAKWNPYVVEFMMEDIKNKCEAKKIVKDKKL